MNLLRLVFLCAVLIGISVAAPMNVALGTNGGVATQSSTYDVYSASLGNDGILTNMTATNNGEMNAWWKVVFDNTYTISSINVYNRTDGNGANTNPFSMFLYDSGNTVVWSATGQSIDSSNFATYTVPNINALTMQFQLDGAGYLGLAEIQVLGDVLAVVGGGDPGGDPGAETPELATYMLIASGLAMMALRRRREA